MVYASTCAFYGDPAQLPSKIDKTLTTEIRRLNMNKNFKILLLNLPSPPGQRLWRDTAGGFGTAISCRHNYRQKGETTLHPFLPYASSLLLEHGYEFKIIDCQRLKLNQPQVLYNVKKENPDIIISIISLPSLKNDVKILDKIKESTQNVTIIGAGTLCRVIPTEVLLKSKVDVVLRNSYPYISNMIDLIQALQQSRNLKKVNGISYIRKGKIIHTPESSERDLGDLPPPCYDFLQLDGYETFTDITGEQHPYVPIVGSKGCPYPCIYCPYPVGFGRKWTHRSPKEMVDEIEYLHNIRNIKAFLLRDQSFTLSKRHAVKICEEIMRRKLDISWFTEARADEITRELLEEMKKAGCKRIHYGVETGDPEILKTAKPGVTLGDIRKAFRLTKEIGLWAQAHIILGWPDDNQETIKKTYNFLLDLNPDNINLNFLTPYPGTKMYEIARRNSLLLTHDWSNYTSHSVVMRTKYLSADQLYAACRRIICDYSKKKLRRLLLRPEMHILKHPPLFISEARKLISNIISQ